MYVYGAAVLRVDEQARVDCMVDLGFRCFLQICFALEGLEILCPEKARLRLEELLALSSGEGVLIESSGEFGPGVWGGIFKIRLPDGTIMELNQQLVEEGLATLTE